jgi:hypothetical protein
VGSDEFNGDEHAGYVSRFDAEGVPLDFSTTGTSSLFVSPEGPFTNFLGVAVDNSSGANQHRLYVSQFEDSLLYSFDPSGEGLWSLAPRVGQLEDVGVDTAGRPWTIGSSSPATQYENTSGRPQPTGCSIPGEGGTAIDADAQGNIYLSRFGAVLKYTETGNCTFTESTFDPNATDVSVDQTSPTGKVFTVQPGDFEEYDSSGTLLGTFGSEYLSAEGARLAYNPSRDWIYVTQRFEPHPVVAVFGPIGGGTVPDVTAIATPTAVGISSAHFEGMVNPHNVVATAHFEWRRPGESWAAAETSPPQALTPNESPQAVAFDAKSLRGNSTYEVRLVTVNSGIDKLHSFSAEVKEFSTSEAPSAPDVSIATPILVTASSATIEGTVNPKGDTADWRVQLSTDSTCAEGFVDERLQQLEQGSSSPVGVSYGLEGLLPSQHYCVRIVATNSFGTEVSSVEELETEAVAPDEVELLPAAPREESSALLNARVNPRGDALTYRFEYSGDGGATWTSLPLLEETSESREKIVIGEVVSGLQPLTTYRFRLGLVEGSAGPVTPTGERELATRSAEASDSSCANASVRAIQNSRYLRHCRAFELVNNPDKGAQDVLLGETAGDGNHALWLIPGGAPGSPSGTSSTFLAERTPTGWRSQSIAPSASEQIGGGTWNYLVEATSSDFSTVIAAPSNRNSEESALVRLRPGGAQELLRSYPNEERRIPFNGGDITADAAHVLFINGELTPPQIEEVGAGEPAEVVSVMPDGTPSECGMSTGNEGDNFTGVSGSGHGAGRDWRPGYHRISTVDASRLYFQVQPNGECGSSSLALYQRNRVSGQTTLIDSGSAAGEPHIIRATPDGRAAYFGTPSALDPADENQHEDVYRWEEGGGAVCLTCEATPDARLESDSPIMVSDDFSHVYFTSASKLAPAAAAGARNIYVLEHGDIGFVATLPAGSGGGSGLRSGGTQLSVDGNVLLFPSVSGQTLTADDVVGEVELYRYDDGDGSLECVSCRHGASTADPVRGEFKMSADGSTVAFVTATPLAGVDVNDDSDIYEWRDGKVALITDGLQKGARPRLAGVSRDGSDVFFSIVNPGLTGFERDGLRNAYDARISGGFQPPSPPAHCDGDSCQGPLLPALTAPAPASSSFHGKGNVGHRRKPRCHRGKGRRHRHCGRHHRHKHRHGKKGGAK